MQTCRYCESTEIRGTICDNCARRLGLAPAPPVRTPRPCTRCGHEEHVRALVRELTASPGEHGVRETVPMAVTYEPVASLSFWTSSRVGAGIAQPAHSYGILEMEVCRGCGFTEWYCRDPQAIPIGDEYGTELVRAEKSGPYR